MDFITVILTSILSLAALFAMTKLSGNKQVSELTIYDYIISISIGSIAAELATELEKPIFPLMALIIYGLAAYIISKASAKSIKLRRIFYGKCITLVYGGKFIRENFIKANLDISEFLTQCRTNGYFDVSVINTAILEPSGKISILPFSQNKPATPANLKLTVEKEDVFLNVVLDGEIMSENLQFSGFDEKWLKAELKNRGGVKLHEIFLATLDRNGTLNIFKGDEPALNNDFFQ